MFKTPCKKSRDVHAGFIKLIDRIMMKLLRLVSELLDGSILSNMLLSSCCLQRLSLSAQEDLLPRIHLDETKEDGGM